MCDFLSVCNIWSLRNGMVLLHISFMDAEGFTWQVAPFSSRWYNLWLERIISWNNVCSYCTKPHPSCYNNAILKKLVVFLGEVTTVQVVQQAYWKRFMIFHLSRNAQVRMEVRCEGSFAKLGWSYGACEWAVANYFKSFVHAGTLVRLALCGSGWNCSWHEVAVFVCVYLLRYIGSGQSMDCPMQTLDPITILGLSAQSRISSQHLTASLSIPITLAQLHVVVPLPILVKVKSTQNRRWHGKQCC